MPTACIVLSCYSWYAMYIYLLVGCLVLSVGALFCASTLLNKIEDNKNKLLRSYAREEALEALLRDTL